MSEELAFAAGVIEQMRWSAVVNGQSVAGDSGSMLALARQAYRGERVAVMAGDEGVVIVAGDLTTVMSAALPAGLDRGQVKGLLQILEDVVRAEDHGDVDGAAAESAE